MRAIGALWVSVGFGLACSGVGGEPPAADLPVDAVPASPSEPIVLGLLRPRDGHCELVASPHGPDADDEVVVATVAEDCPAGTFRIAWTDDRLLVSSNTGLWEVVPARAQVTALPAAPDGAPHGVAFDQGVPTICQDLQTTWKADGDEVVVTYKGKDWRAPKVDDALEYTLSRWWRLDPDLWVDVGTEVTPIFEGQAIACDAADRWPRGDQACPTCPGPIDLWRSPDEAETAALAAIGTGAWLVTAGPNNAAIVAAHGEQREMAPPILTLPLVDGHTWKVVADGTGGVLVETFGENTWMFQAADQSWKLFSGGEVDDLGTELPPFVWPDGLDYTPSEDPVAEEPAPDGQPTRTAPRREPKPMVHPVKQRPGEGKAGKGKGKAKAKAE